MKISRLGKQASLVTLGALVLGAFALWGARALAQPSKPPKPPTFDLRCNTKGMKPQLRIWTYRHSSPSVRIDAPVLITLVKEFTRAPQSAKVKEPGPGQCAFFDRPVAPNEPNLIAFLGDRGPEIWIDVDAAGRLQVRGTSLDPEPEYRTYGVYQAGGGEVGMVPAFHVDSIR